MGAFVALLLCAGGAVRAEAPELEPASGDPTNAIEPARAAAAAGGSATVSSTPSASGVSMPGSNEVATDSSAAPKGDAANADDPESQAEVDKSAAELEEVRKAEEKAGLLPQAPGAGPHEGLAIGLDPWDPVARDLFSARGTSVDGAPLADPAPSGLVQVRLAELAGISEDELRAKYDIPVELNDAVVAYIRFFQTDARVHFTKWLARSTRFMPLMRGILAGRVFLGKVHLAQRFRHREQPAPFPDGLRQVVGDPAHVFVHRADFATSPADLARSHAREVGDRAVGHESTSKAFDAAVDSVLAGLDDDDAKRRVGHVVP